MVALATERGGRDSLTRLANKTNLPATLLGVRREEVSTGTEEAGTVCWPIEDFAALPQCPGQKLSSPVFCGKGEPWVLELFPAGRAGSPDHAGLYLRYVGKSAAVEVKFRLAIVCPDDVETFEFVSPVVTLGERKQHDQGVFATWGSSKFCPRICFANNNAGLMNQGILTVKCDINIVEALEYKNPLRGRRPSGPASSPSKPKRSPEDKARRVSLDRRPAAPPPRRYPLPVGPDEKQRPVTSLEKQRPATSLDVLLPFYDEAHAARRSGASDPKAEARRPSRCDSPRSPASPVIDFLC